MKSMTMPQLNCENTLRDVSLTLVQPEFQRTPSASPPHPGSELGDASLALFRGLKKYAGRLLIESPSDHPVSNEAALICQILFLTFAEGYITSPMRPPLLDAAATEHVSPSHFYRERLAPRLKSWFGNAPDPASVDSNQLFELIADLFSRYAFALVPPKTDNGTAPVAPWILA